MNSPSVSQSGVEPRSTSALGPREAEPQSWWSSLCVLPMYTALAIFHTFALLPILYKYLHYQSPAPLTDNLPIELDAITDGPVRDCEANTPALDSEHDYRDQWNGTVAWLVKGWSVACTGCFVLIPFPLGFFQLECVSESVYTRTGVLSMMICSGIGLMTAGFYLQMQSRLVSTGFARQWIMASQSLKSRRAVDFWTCICLPISHFVWSLFFCTVTLFTVAFCNVSSEGPKTGQTAATGEHTAHFLSIVFLVIFTVGHLLQVYRFGTQIISMAKLF